MQSLRAAHALADLLAASGLARSTLYYHVAGRQTADKYAEVKAQITALFREHEERYGYRRIRSAVVSTGRKISGKTVRKLMSQLQLKCPVRKKKYRAWRGDSGRVAENILQRHFKAERPGEKWVTDVTEFKAGGRKLYLSPVLDLFNGEIVAWETAESPGMALVNGMLEKALKKRRKGEPLLLHSDQGWHYQMKSWQEMLRSEGVQQSMSRRGNCLDNAVMENFFGHLKAEMYYRRASWNRADLEKEIKAYIDYWNHKRIKLGLGGLSPVEYRTEYQRAG